MTRATSSACEQGAPLREQLAVSPSDQSAPEVLQVSRLFKWSYVQRRVYSDSLSKGEQNLRKTGCENLTALYGLNTDQIFRLIILRRFPRHFVKRCSSNETSHWLPELENELLRRSPVSLTV